MSKISTPWRLDWSRNKANPRVRHDQYIRETPDSGSPRSNEHLKASSAKVLEKLRKRTLDLEKLASIETGARDREYAVIALNERQKELKASQGLGRVARRSEANKMYHKSQLAGMHLREEDYRPPDRSWATRVITTVDTYCWKLDEMRSWYDKYAPPSPRPTGREDRNPYPGLYLTREELPGAKQRTPPVSTRRSSLPDATPRSLPGAERMAKLSAQITDGPERRPQRPLSVPALTLPSQPQS